MTTHTRKAPSPRRPLAAVLTAATLTTVGLTMAGTLAAAQPAEAEPGSSTVAVGAYPLHTSGRWIEDSQGKRVKLASVNWDGAESPEYVVGGLDRVRLPNITHWIKANGFNSVRLPWSNEMYEHNPKVKDEYVKANPALKGKRALEIFDQVIDALGKEGLMVILDNHVSRADWCCDSKDGNGLWYAFEYSESAWIADWKGIVARYRNNHHVVGVELRNEVRPANGVTPTWGTGDDRTDWHRAATKAGNEVLSVNHGLLVVIGGLNYQTDLRGVGQHPVTLSVPNRVVYAPHTYKWSYAEVSQGWAKFKEKLGKEWGYILVQGKPYTAPLWVSEFGTCITWKPQSCDQNDANFSNGIQRYLKEADIDWAYWQLNGTQSDSLARQGMKRRTHGAQDWYGLLNTAWNGPADANSVDKIKALQRMTQRV